MATPLPDCPQADDAEHTAAKRRQLWVAAFAVQTPVAVKAYDQDEGDEGDFTSYGEGAAETEEVMNTMDLSGDDDIISAEKNSGLQVLRCWICRRLYVLENSKLREVSYAETGWE